MANPVIQRLLLIRTMCFGRCPAYKMLVTGDGEVLFRGEACVIQEGSHRWSISEGKLGALAELLREWDFFALAPPQGISTSCSQGITVGVRMSDGRYHRLEFTFGDGDLDTLANHIDKLTGVFDYAYRPLNHYRLSAECDGATIHRRVLACNAAHARFLLNENPPEGAGEAERGLAESAWKVKNQGPSKRTYPAEGGFVEGQEASVGPRTRFLTTRADRFTWQEGELRISQCIRCVHKFAGHPGCTAFPDRIPMEIGLNEHDHREPFPGDHGIRFVER